MNPAPPVRRMERRFRTAGPSTPDRQLLCNWNSQNSRTGGEQTLPEQVSRRSIPEFSSRRRKLCPRSSWAGMLAPWRSH